MLFRIQISTKNKKSLKSVLSAISNLKMSNRLVKCFSKQNRKKFVTVLKSPHVNKSAQEQFEYRTSSKIFLLHSSQPIKDLFALKTLKNSSFSGVKWRISTKQDSNETFKYLLSKLSPDNSKLKLTENLLSKKKAQRYIQSFDNYGELALKKVQILSNFNKQLHL